MKGATWRKSAYTRPCQFLQQKLASRCELDGREINLLKGGLGLGRGNLGEEGREGLDEIQEPYCGRVGQHPGTRLQLARGPNASERGDSQSQRTTYSRS